MRAGFDITLGRRGQRTLAAALLLTACCLGGASVAIAAGLVVEHAWIRAAPPNAPVMAGYLILNNDSDHAIVVAGADSADFARVEIHETVSKDGRMHMQHRPNFEIAAHSRVRFEPSGMHIMLIEPKRKLAVGDRVAVNFKLTDGGSMPFELTIQPVDFDPTTIK